MKILIITPRIPYPPYRGDKLKIFNIAKNLVKNNEVKILTFYQDRNDFQFVEKIRALNIDIEVIKLSFIKSFFNAALGIFNKIPFQVAYYKSSLMMKKIREVANNDNFDVIYFHLIRSAQFFEAVSETTSLKVIDFTDAVSLYLTRYLEVERNIFKKLLIKIELNRIKEYEKISRKFNTLFVCSEKDREFLKERNVCENIQLLQNGIDLEYFYTTEQIAPQKHRLIFTGNMPYFANYDAVLYFANSIFPLVLEKVPDAKFYVVGQKPPRKIRNLNSANIIVTGFVKDIKHEYLLSEINIAPIRFGAGTLNKILESIALGVPVISTSVSIAGLPEELKKYIFIADTPKDFADKIIFIFNNSFIKNDLMKAGQEKISRLLNWKIIIKEFEDYLYNEINECKVKTKI